MKTKSLLSFSLLLLIAVLSGSSSTSAQVLRGENSLGGLKSIYIVTESIGRFDPADGLTGEQLREDAEKKLRQAGIKIMTEEEWPKAEGRPMLHIDIDYWKNEDGSFLANLELKVEQHVFLERDPSIKVDSITWMESQIILPKAGKLAEDVRNELGILMDKFIVDYKAANQK